MTLRNGLLVTVASTERGEVLARVEDLRKLPDLPNLEPLHVDQVRAILAEADVDAVAMLSYPYGAHQLMFAALHLRTADTWQDLAGQTLTIEQALTTQ